MRHFTNRFPSIFGALLTTILLLSCTNGDQTDTTHHSEPANSSPMAAGEILLEEGLIQYNWNGETLEHEQVSGEWERLFPATGTEIAFAAAASHFHQSFEGAGVRVENGETGESLTINFDRNPVFYSKTIDEIVHIYLPCLNGKSWTHQFAQNNTLEVRSEPTSTGGFRQVAVDAKGGGTTILVIDPIGDPEGEFPPMDFGGNWDEELPISGETADIFEPGTCKAYSEVVLIATGSKVELVQCGYLLYFVVDGKTCAGAIRLDDFECGFCIVKTESNGNTTYTVKASQKCISRLKANC